MLFDKTKHFWTNLTKMTKLTKLLLSLLHCRSRVFSIMSLLTEQSQSVSFWRSGHTTTTTTTTTAILPRDHATWLINITNSPRHQVNFCKIPPPPTHPPPPGSASKWPTPMHRNFSGSPPPPPPQPSPPLFPFSFAPLVISDMPSIVLWCLGARRCKQRFTAASETDAGTTRREQRGNRQ